MDVDPSDPAGTWDPAPGLPNSLQLEPSSACNLRCRTCPLTTGGTASGRAPGPATDTIWRRATDHLQPGNLVILSGFGEPFTDPRFLDRLTDLERRGLTYTFSTNAHLVDGDRARTLAGLNGLIHVNVSLDAGDAETYRLIRGGDFAAALAGLKHLQAHLGARLTVSVIASRPVAAAPDRLGAALASVGVRTLVLQELKPYRDDLDSLVTGQEDYRRVARELGGHLQRVETHQAAQHIAANLTIGSSRICELPWVRPYIDRQGRVFSCCDAAATDAPALGDLATDELATVWQGPGFQALRRALATGHGLPPACRDCAVAPRGHHPRVALRGVVLAAWVESQRLRVAIANRGTLAWIPATRVWLACPDAKLVPPAGHHPSWTTPLRLATHQQFLVPPAGVATFTVPLAPIPSGQGLWLQLVAEETSWLPGTAFVLHGRDNAPPAIGLEPVHHPGQPGSDADSVQLAVEQALRGLLGRTADAGDQAFWAAHLASPDTRRTDALADVLASTEFQTGRAEPTRFLRDAWAALTATDLAPDRLERLALLLTAGLGRRSVARDLAEDPEALQALLEGRAPYAGFPPQGPKTTAPST